MFPVNQHLLCSDELPDSAGLAVITVVTNQRAPLWNIQWLKTQKKTDRTGSGSLTLFLEMHLNSCARPTPWSWDGNRWRWREKDGEGERALQLLTGGGRRERVRDKTKTTKVARTFFFFCRWKQNPFAANPVSLRGMRLNETLQGPQCMWQCTFVCVWIEWGLGKGLLVHVSFRCFFFYLFVTGAL